MKIKLGSKIGGHFKWEILTENGSVRESSEWQPNLILDSGLDYVGGAYIGFSSLVQFLHVGTGNSTPSPSQTGLDAPDKSALTLSSGGYVARQYALNPAQDYYVGDMFRYVFPAQATAYNVSELGVSPSTDSTVPMVTRALVKDAQGNPTTISVRANETLIVHYEFRLYIDKAYENSFDYDMDIKGATKTFSVTVRPWLYTNYYVYNTAYVSATRSASPINYAQVYSVLPDPDVTVLNAGQEYGDLLGLDGAYVQGSHSRNMKITLQRDKGNFSDGVRGFKFLTTLGCWVASITDKTDNTKGIIKTGDDIMEIPVQVSWGRYTGAIV